VEEGGGWVGGWKETIKYGPVYVCVREEVGPTIAAACLFTTGLVTGASSYTAASRASHRACSADVHVTNMLYVGSDVCEILCLNLQTCTVLGSAGPRVCICPEACKL
jgi:hypothetical protein